MTKSLSSLTSIKKRKRPLSISLKKNLPFPLFGEILIKLPSLVELNASDSNEPKPSVAIEVNER
jgi:hypothetical protein